MADRAGVGNVQQRTLKVVVGEFFPAFGPIRHVAIGAGDVAVGVNTRGVDLVVRVADLNHRRVADGVGEVGKAGFVEIGLACLRDGALVPREGQVIALRLEVVFHVALAQTRVRISWCDT